MARCAMPFVAEQMDIRLENLGWVASYHLRDDLLHLHFAVWDKKDKFKKYNKLNIPKESLKNIRRIFTKEIHKDRAIELKFVKTANRDYLLMMKHHFIGQ